MRCDLGTASCRSRTSTQSGVFGLLRGSVTRLAFLLVLLTTLFALAAPEALADDYLYGSKGFWFWEDVDIPDDGVGNHVWMSVDLSGAPSNAEITKVKLHYIIRHGYIGDLKVWATAEYGGSWHDHILWNRSGGSADDLDKTHDNLHTWDGASPNNRWYLSADDQDPGVAGYIDYFEIWTYYDVPKPNLTPYKPSGWSDKIVTSTNTGDHSDDTLYTWKDIYVDWGVLNNGDAPTDTYFYTKLQVDGSDKQTWRTDPPLNVYYYTSVNDYNIGKLSAGWHSLTLIADSSDRIGETSESDNSYTKWIYVNADTDPPTQPGKPDMSSGDDSGSSSNDDLTNDTSIRFDWGASSDSGTGVKGYWWAIDDSTPESGGNWTANTYCTGVNPPEGSHTIYVKAEDNAGNRSSYSYLTFQIDRSAPPPPTFSWPGEGDIITDETPTLKWYSVSGAWKYQAYVREDTWIPIDSRESSEITSTEWTVSPALGYKAWGWQVRVRDHAGNLGSYGKNGTAGAWGHFTVQGPPDLRVDSVDAPDGVYGPGDSFDVSNSVRNIGPGPCSGYTVRFYASTNTIITTGDTEIGSFSRGSLASGDTHNYSSPVTLPSSLPPSQYYIGMIVTCDDDQDTSNNTGYDATPIDVLKTDARMSVPYYNQDSAQWCWACSGSMMLEYYGYQRKPWQIAADFDKGKGDGLIGWDLVMNSLENYLETYYSGGAVDAWGHETYWINANLIRRLKQVLSTGHPVYLGCNEAAHAVVVAGYDGLGDEDHVYIHDPSGALTGTPLVLNQARFSSDHFRSRFSPVRGASGAASGTRFLKNPGTILFAVLNSPCFSRSRIASERLFLFRA